MNVWIVEQWSKSTLHPPTCNPGKFRARLSVYLCVCVLYLLYRIFLQTIDTHIQTSGVMFGNFLVALSQANLWNHLYP